MSSAALSVKILRPSAVKISSSLRFNFQLMVQILITASVMSDNAIVYIKFNIRAGKLKYFSFRASSLRQFSLKWLKILIYISSEKQFYPFHIKEISPEMLSEYILNSINIQDSVRFHKNYILCKHWIHYVFDF
jgi:hypothetical protein